MRAMPAAVALCAALITAVPAPADQASALAARARCAHAKARPTPATLGQAREATLCLINAVRAGSGLVRLRPMRALERSSQTYARLMKSRHFFAHTSPGGTGPPARAHRAGLGRFGLLGETLYWGPGPGATPLRAVRAWLASPGHRRILLSGVFRRAGIGIASGAPVRLPRHVRAATYVLDVADR